MSQSRGHDLASLDRRSKGRGEVGWDIVMLLIYTIVSWNLESGLQLTVVKPFI